MQLNRMVLQWGGPQITGVAVTVLHFAGDVGAPNPANVFSAFNAYKGLIPAGVSVTIPGTGDVLEDTTGRLTDVWSAAGGGTVMGNGGTGACAKGVGAVINWKTGAIVNGRRLRGRTFIVPINAGSMGNDGNIEGNTMVALQTLANALQASGPLAVWHRPTTKGGVDGTSAGVVANVVKNKVAYLSSRRD